jgi:hypothetical protein
MTGSAFDTYPRIFRKHTAGATGIAPEFTPAVDRSLGTLSPHPVDGMHDTRLDEQDVARMDYVAISCIVPEVRSGVN